MGEVPLYVQAWARLLAPIGAIGALMNRVLQPRPLIVLGLNVCPKTQACPLDGRATSAVSFEMVCP